MFGPTCIFWANLTPFLLQLDESAADDDVEINANFDGDGGATRARSHFRF
jgi:hypothetical protein